MILRKLKLVCAIGLVVLMFLPLAQCSSEAVADRPAKTDTIYVIDIDNLPKEFAKFVPALVFSFPLFLMLFTLWGRREKLRHEVFDIVAGALVLSLMYIYYMFSKLLPGGIAVIALSLMFAVFSLAEAIQTIRARGGVFPTKDSEDFDA